MIVFALEAVSTPCRVWASVHVAGAPPGGLLLAGDSGSESEISAATAPAGSQNPEMAPPAATAGAKLIAGREDFGYTTSVRLRRKPRL
eukprot:scaffold268311_cov40-Tisochrysis_lutea.AAC.1